MSTNNREKEIFEQALDLPSAEARQGYVKGACGGDAGLLARVETLLRAHEATGGFLPENPAASGPTMVHAKAESPEKPGTSIGRYKLLQELGEGGCGVVYMAEQEIPVRRRVALKVIKLGMDTKAVIARFEAERQALAMMDHPNIAKVLDAGATETGRPYFVMELVRGLPITTYCDQSQLPMADRLNLFIQVCHAIQHAHQKGIIHRDIKPSNILVTLHDGVPVPKVIDFGIAKATLGRLTDQTVFTAFEQFIGTPAYMSPEQAEMSGLDIDTRSDIYSLGVLLYELLTGRPPFDPQTLMKAGLDEIRRLIREVEPPKPSTRLSTQTMADNNTLAKLRGTDAAKLSLLIRGDLDWIVMKALEKNRTRRYETAGAFAADIQRHLHNEPVTARPPSTAYLLQKLISRNRLAFAATTAIAAALVIGLGVATWAFIQEKAARQRAVAAEQEQVVQRQQAENARNEEAKQRVLAEEARSNEAKQRALAEAEEKKARTAAAKSEQAFKFMSKMLEGVGPSVAAGRDTTLLREILDKTVKRLEKSMQDQPEVDVKLRTILGGVYADLGDYTKAEAIAREALAKSTALFGRDHVDVAEALALLGMTRLMQGHAAESETLVREALAIVRKLPEKKHEELTACLAVMGTALLGLGKLPEAETQFREALVILQQHPEIDFEGNKVDGVRTMLASVLQKQGRLAEAEPLMRAALAAQKTHLADNHPMVGYSMAGLSNVLMMQGKLVEAESTFRESLVILKKSLGPEHPNIAMILTNLGVIALQQRKLPEAEAALNEAIALQVKVLGKDHPTTNQSRMLLADVLHLQGKADAAAAQNRDAQAGQRKTLGSEDQATADTKAMAALTAMRQGKWAEAEANLKEALPVAEQVNGRDHQATLGLRLMLADAIFRQNRPAESETILREVLADTRRAFGDKSTFVASTLGQLSRSLNEQDKLAETEACLREALAIFKTQTTDSVSAGVADTLLLLATMRARLGDATEASAFAKEAAAVSGKLPENQRNNATGATESMATRLKQQEKLSEAEKVERITLEFLVARDGRDGNPLAQLLVRLAQTLNQAGKFVEAEPLAREGWVLRRKLRPATDWTVPNAQSVLGQSLFGAKKYAEAEATLTEAFSAMQQNKPPGAESAVSSWRARLRVVTGALEKLCEETNQPAKAAEWKLKRAEFTGPAATPAPAK